MWKLSFRLYVASILSQYRETRLIILRQMSQLKLLTIETQVAFVVTDSTQDTDTTHWAGLAEEVLYCTVLCCTLPAVLYCTVQGQNLAFITRLPVSGGECDWGLRCVASSLGSLLVAGHEAALSEEMELFQQVSEEQMEMDSYLLRTFSTTWMSSRWCGRGWRPGRCGCLGSWARG